jgi:glycerol-3-phosphate acyltransferase PlsX
MGGDHGPAVTLPACRAFLGSHPGAELVLVGTEAALAPAAGWARCTRVIATEVVTMDDPVEVALRKKRDSSLRVALQQVKDGATTGVQACVSAGNTGALMAVAPTARPSPPCCPTAPTATPRCSTSAPTSTARPSTCCSLR